MSEANTTKFEQLVHYIMWYCKQYQRQHHLGSIKLNKILWLLDVWQYCHEGSSMSGEEYYIKRQHGPVPSSILATQEKLANRGVLKIKEYTDKMRIDIGSAEITRPKSNDINLLNPEELEQIKHFCKELMPLPAKALSKYSHDDVYDAYEEGEQIPLSAYLVSKRVHPTKEAIEWAKKSIASSNLGKGEAIAI